VNKIWQESCVDLAKAEVQFKNLAVNLISSELPELFVLRPAFRPERHATRKQG